MNKECKIVTDCSKEIYDWQTFQPEVGEESITDWLLYKSSVQSTRIHYQLFNKIQEARTTGADFEFWILTKTINFKARIQAKRLRKGKDHYSAIHYSNKHGLQIDKLIKDSSKNSARPFYAFYNNEDSTTSCKNNSKGQGVYISCANKLNKDIINQPRQRIDTNFLISRSIPFSCWFCCPLCKLNRNNSIVQFLKEYYNFEGLEFDGLTEIIPEYLNQLLEIKESENDEKLSGWMSEYKEDIDNIKSIWIIDERGKKN